MKWCAWCGETIESTDGRRKVCNGYCSNANRNVRLNEKYMARFDAGEELSDWQFARINLQLNPRVLKPHNIIDDVMERKREKHQAHQKAAWLKAIGSFRLPAGLMRKQV